MQYRSYKNFPLYFERSCISDAKSVFIVPISRTSFYCSADDASEALDGDGEVQLPMKVGDS